MFVCVCTYHEPVAGYTYLNSLPVYKVIKTHTVNVSTRTRKTHFIWILILKNTKNTNAVCVCVLAGRSAALLLWCHSTFSLAPGNGSAGRHRMHSRQHKDDGKTLSLSLGGWVGGWGQFCAHMDKFYIYSGYFWDEESDFAIHFNLEPTVFALGGPEKVRPATENGAKRRLNVRISKLRHDH